MLILLCAGFRGLLRTTAGQTLESGGRECGKSAYQRGGRESTDASNRHFVRGGEQIRAVSRGLFGSLLDDPDADGGAPAVVIGAHLLYY